MSFPSSNAFTIVPLGSLLLRRCLSFNLILNPFFSVLSNSRRLCHSRLARTLLLDQGLSPSYYVPNQATLVDYGPCIRRIVQFENSEVKKFDQEEDLRISNLLNPPSSDQVAAGFNLGSARNALGTSRSTRNSSRNAIIRREYNRWCRVDETAARAAEKSGFRLEIEM